MTRTRFAPSPTGFMHVGGVRTALFAWLVARQSSGQFILRIEDTDRSRHVEESEQLIVDSLKWLGIESDEPIVRQSQRLEIYKEWAQKLVDSGRAYADTTSEVELNKLREAAYAAKKPFLYRDNRPGNPDKWEDGKPLRFLSKPKAYRWHDEVMGDMGAGPNAIDDFILIKSDGFPTYNFAHIVDDYLMKISHVIRSTEFLSSVPNYLNLYEALDIEHPIFATAPVVLGTDGKKKLSKRDGAKDILDYKKEGYLPDALINFMASLGWNDGSEQEIFSVQELIQKFELSRVQKSGAHFDEKRLEWMNGHYVRAKSLDELLKVSVGFWPESAAGKDDNYKRQILSAVQERLKYLAELPDLTSFFFSEPAEADVIKLYEDPLDKGLRGVDKLEITVLLETSRQKLESADFATAALNKTLDELLTQLGTSRGVLFAGIRVALTGSANSPSLADTMAILGKDACLQRIDNAIRLLS